MNTVHSLQKFIAAKVAPDRFQLGWHAFRPRVSKGDKESLNSLYEQPTAARTMGGDLI